TPARSPPRRDRRSSPPPRETFQIELLSLPSFSPSRISQNRAVRRRQPRARRRSAPPDTLTIGPSRDSFTAALSQFGEHFLGEHEGGARRSFARERIARSV